MKYKIKGFLQSLLGYERYLKWFAYYKIKTLHNDKREASFFDFLSRIKTDDCVLDIGANLGFINYHIAQKAKYVYAFEPEPTNRKVLKNIIARYKLNNVKLMEFALGDEAKMVEMVLPIRGKSKEQGLSHVEQGEACKGINFSVECKRLDDLDLPKIDAIKIDVENFEYAVFKGGEATIKRDKPLIYCELWDNENRANCLEFLGGMGYQCLVFTENGRVPFNVSKHRYYQNFLFEYEG